MGFFSFVNTLGRHNICFSIGNTGIFVRTCVR